MQSAENHNEAVEKENLSKELISSVKTILAENKDNIIREDNPYEDYLDRLYLKQPDSSDEIIINQFEDRDIQNISSVVYLPDKEYTYQKFFIFKDSKVMFEKGDGKGRKEPSVEYLKSVIGTLEKAKPLDKSRKVEEDKAHDMPKRAGAQDNVTTPRLEEKSPIDMLSWQDYYQNGVRWLANLSESEAQLAIQDMLKDGYDPSYLFTGPSYNLDLESPTGEEKGKLGIYCKPLEKSE